MYEDSEISTIRHLHLLRTIPPETSDIVSDCAVMENLRGNNSDSGIGIEKDELISRDGSSSSSKCEKLFDYQSRCDSARTDSGFESFRSERLNSGDSSSWKISSDYIPPLSPTEECEIVSSLPNTKLYTLLETNNYGISNTSTTDVTEQFKNLNFSDPVSRNTKPYSDIGSYYEQDDEGDTILHLAIIHGLIDVVTRLIQCVVGPFRPAFLNLQNYLHQTPLHLAVITNQPLIVRKLVVAGVEMDIRDRRGNTALHIACERGFFLCAQALLNPLKLEEINKYSLGAHYQDLELLNYEGQTCMHLATLSQDIQLLCLLKHYDADVNSQECKSGRTPLHYAVEIQNLKIVNILVTDCQADTNSKTFAGLTPIQFAYNRNKDIVRSLILLGARDVGLPLSDSESDSSSDETSKMDTIDDSEFDFYVNGQPLRCY